jgi:hypothetical protein
LSSSIIRYTTLSPQSADGRLNRSLDKRRFDVEPYVRRDIIEKTTDYGKMRMISSGMIMTRAVLTYPKRDAEHGFFSGMSFLEAIGKDQSKSEDKQ